MKIAGCHSAMHFFDGDVSRKGAMKQLFIGLIASPDDSSTRGDVQEARYKSDRESLKTLSFRNLGNSIDQSIVSPLVLRKRSLSL